MTGDHNLSSLIWGSADILYNHVEQANYHKVILPMTLLRRFDCALTDRAVEGQKTPQDSILELKERFGHLLKGTPAEQKSFHQMAYDIVGFRFYNVSGLNFKALAESSSSSILSNYRAYIAGFSPEVQDILQKFSFTGHTPYLEMLQEKGILLSITRRFAELDLSPTALPNEDMGEIYEELVRKWADSIKADAGEFFTPRDIVRLLVDLVMDPDEDEWAEGEIRTAYDPTAGTGGILTASEHHVKEKNPSRTINLYGQEIKDISYAVCKADMLIKHADALESAEFEIEHGNTLTKDKFPGKTFEYILANPPYGAPWGGKNLAEHEKSIRAQIHRFPGGFPQAGDSALLFVQHIVSKMKPAAEGGSRAGIILAGSPLFNGDAGSGESEIRRYLIEHDLIEAIVALPTELFFDTGIGTFIWVLSNRKENRRKGKIQLIDARNFGTKVRKPTGMKRYELDDAQREAIAAAYDGFEADSPVSKVFDASFFGYRKVKVKIGKETDYERMSLDENIDEYMAREVLPFEPKAVVDTKYTDTRTGEVGRIGYEINFNRYFYVAKELEPSADILKRIQALEGEFVELMKGLA